MKKNNMGSALAWALGLMLLAVFIMAAIIPLASAMMTASNNTNYKQQAYYTARSSADMVAEYLVSDVDNDPGKSILEKAKAAGEEGTTWSVQGLDADMGTCQVTVAMKEGALYVTAHAQKGKQEKKVTIKLLSTQSATELTTPETIITGYNGVRVNNIHALYDWGGVLDQTKGNSLKTKSGNVLVANENNATLEEIDKDPEKVIVDQYTASAFLQRGDSYTETSTGTSGGRLFIQSDVVVHSAIQNQVLSSIVANGNIVLDNEENLFRSKSNYISTKADANGVYYNFYSAKALKLTGQIQIMENPRGNITIKNCILSGRDVDKTSDIPGGFTSTNHTFYVQETMKADYVYLSGRGSEQPVVINGPLYVTNEYGPSTFTTTNGTNYTQPVVPSDGCFIKTKGKYPITFNGNIQCVAEEAKQETVKKEGNPEKVKEYEGNVDIDTTDNEDAKVTVNGHIIGKGSIHLKGNVEVTGHITGKDVVIEGSDVKISDGVYAYHSFTYIDDNGNQYYEESPSTTKALGGFTYQAATDSYDFTPYASMTNSTKMNKGSMDYYNSFKNITHTNIYKENLTEVIDDADTNHPKTIGEFKNIKYVSPSLANSEINTLQSGNASEAYEYTGDCNLGDVTISSYGDVYLIVGAGKTVSIDTITTKYATGNVYILVREGATLRLNEVNNHPGSTFNAMIFSEDNATVRVGDNTNIIGTIDVDSLLLGDNVTYQLDLGTTLGSGQQTTEARWKIVQYLGDAN